MLHSSSSRTSLSSLDDAQSLACGVPRSRLHVLATLDVVDALLARYRPRPSILHPPQLLSFAESPALRFLLVDDERYRGDMRIALEEHFALRIDDRGACVVDDRAHVVTRAARDELAGVRMRVSCVPGVDVGCLVAALPLPLPLPGGASASAAAAAAAAAAARGPTPASNWVVAQRVLCGAYPGAPHEPLHSATVDALMRAGVTTFVSLIESHEERIMPVPYAAAVDEWLRAHPALRRPPARFLSLPTPDQDVARYGRAACVCVRSVGNAASRRPATRA
jgi:hypothetical protein